ncbi:MAG: glutamine-hydrolyzing carbamoyl-phosphate synthase small subunit [Pseudomonadota bacterium]
MPTEQQYLPLDKKHNAMIIFADSTILYGYGLGFVGSTSGEICFNTAMTGYQEILTDPSYSQQIINFNFPHIGNVGVNDIDVESANVKIKGAIFRNDITGPSNYRSQNNLIDYLTINQIPAICDVDTRFITRKIRSEGVQNVTIINLGEQQIDSVNIEEEIKKLQQMPSLAGMELALQNTAAKAINWQEKPWQIQSQSQSQFQSNNKMSNGKIVLIDFGCKYNIARLLVAENFEVTIVPANTTFDDIMKLSPDGIFLSNGPGDPAATAAYAAPVIKQLITADLPIYGICLGHQLLSISLGCHTEKMHQGHRGANHPIQDLSDKKVYITSQNHGFVVSDDNLPVNVEVTHRSLFDQTIQAIRVKNKPIFSVQGHPEASPGPHDYQIFFKNFVDEVTKYNKNKLRDTG